MNKKTPAEEADCRGETEFLKAAEEGDLIGMQECLAKATVAQKVIVNQPDRLGTTPISAAVQEGHICAVEYLIGLDVDLNKGDNGGFTPLYYAAADSGADNEAIVQFLLQTGKINSYSSRDFNADFCIFNFDSPLCWAAHWGLPGTMKELLEVVQFNDSIEDNGFSPFSWAIKGGNIEVIKLLISTGKVDWNHRNKDKRTPLALACESGQDEVIRLILSDGQGQVDTSQAIDGYRFHNSTFDRVYAGNRRRWRFV